MYVRGAQGGERAISPPPAHSKRAPLSRLRPSYVRARRSFRAKTLSGLYLASASAKARGGRPRSGPWRLPRRCTRRRWRRAGSAARSHSPRARRGGRCRRGSGPGTARSGCAAPPGPSPPCKRAELHDGGREREREESRDRRRRSGLPFNRGQARAFAAALKGRELKAPRAQLFARSMSTLAGRRLRCPNLRRTSAGSDSRATSASTRSRRRT